MICPKCLGWMAEYLYKIGFIKCSSCGFTEEKKKVKQSVTQGKQKNGN